MTREQAIKHWSDIAETVFWAEERIAKEWDKKLKAAPKLSKADQYNLAMAYCRAVAVEITNHTTDEEYAQMEYEDEKESLYQRTDERPAS